MDEMTIGGRMAYLLKLSGKTQKQVAAEVGTTPVTLSRYMKDQRIPKGPIFAKIAEALDTTTDYLLGVEPAEEKAAKEKEAAQRKAFESEYYTIHRLIVHNAPFMSKRQRNELIMALLEYFPD